MSTAKLMQFALLGIIAVFLLSYLDGAANGHRASAYDVPPASDAASMQAAAAVTAFEWKYRLVKMQDPVTSQVHLVVSYSDGWKGGLDLGTIEGSCSEQSAETTLALNTPELNCYVAGLGHTYRVIDTGIEYQIQRRVSQGSSDGYSAPGTTFETMQILEK